jgi:chromate transporter
LFVIVLGPSFRRFSQNTQLRSFVQGVTAAATGAIAGAVVVLGKHSIHDLWTVSIAAVTFVVLMKWKVPEPIIIAFSGALGILIHLR